MRPGRPKQHIHNWVWEFTFPSNSLASWDHHSKNYGSHGYKVWKCIRGGKIKHIRKEPIFIAGSGLGDIYNAFDISYSLTRDEGFYPR